MRLSATDVYALQALGFLGDRYGEGLTSGDTIVEATGVARAYLARILSSLVASDILISRKGSGGGYALAAEPSSISLRDVMRAIDGPVAPLSCVSLNWHESCELEASCHARGAIWQKVRDAVLTALEDVTVADLVEDRRQGNTYAPCLMHLLRAGA
jgi:Rrf2 family protein